MIYMILEIQKVTHFLISLNHIQSSSEIQLIYRPSFLGFP